MIRNFNPKDSWQGFWWMIKGYLGLATVGDGSCCWFSTHYFDVHDYLWDKGGTGQPSHFYNYTCNRCGRNFFI